MNHIVPGASDKLFKMKNKSRFWSTDKYRGLVNKAILKIVLLIHNYIRMKTMLSTANS